MANDREELGRYVREKWLAWAAQQPNPKPSWLTPWEGLSEPDKEVDRQIGEALFERGSAHVQTGSSLFRILRVDQITTREALTVCPRLYWSDDGGWTADENRATLYANIQSIPRLATHVETVRTRFDVLRVRQLQFEPREA